MRTVWQARGKVMKPYTVADLQTDLAKVTKNPKFAEEFFNQYIYGLDKNNYEALLAKAGFILRKAAPGKVWSGLPTQAIRGRSGQAIAMPGGYAIVANTIQGTPFYKAGIDAGDVLLKADGKDLTDAASFAKVIADKKPGDKITIDYKNRTGAHTSIVTLEENPYLEVVTAEKAGSQVTAEQTTFRNNWLSSKAK